MAVMTWVRGGDRKSEKIKTARAVMAKTQEQVALEAGVSPDTLQRAAKVARQAPEILPAVRDGKLDANLAPAPAIAYPGFMPTNDPPPLPDVPGVEFRPVPGCPEHAAGSDGSVWQLSARWPCERCSPRGWFPVRVFERPGGAVVLMPEFGRSVWRRVEDVVATAFGRANRIVCPASTGALTRGDTARRGMGRFGMAAKLTLCLVRTHERIQLWPKATRL